MMSRKKVLLASSLTLCSASTSFAAGTEEHTIAMADIPAGTNSISKATEIAAKAMNRYLPPLSTFTFGNVATQSNEESQPLTYRVKKGDNLFRIGLYYGIHFQEIASYNHLKDPSEIKTGQNLRIPFIPKWVRVQGKETLQTLAKKHQTTVQLLQNLNPRIQKNDQLSDRWVMIVQKVEVPKIKPVTQLKPSSTNNKRVIKLARKEHDQVSKETTGHSFIWPVTGKITSNFGWRNGRTHKGIDIWNQERSNCEIKASKGGTVSRAGYAGGYGNLVVIDHGNGWKTYYAHLSRIHVSKGQSVSQGDFLGNMGQTGNATGYHLHFEVRKNGNAINPLRFLD